MRVAVTVKEGEMRDESAQALGEARGGDVPDDLTKEESRCEDKAPERHEEVRRRRRYRVLDVLQVWVDRVEASFDPALLSRKHAERLDPLFSVGVGDASGGIDREPADLGNDLENGHASALVRSTGE